MLLVDEVDDKEFLQGLFVAMYEELPEVKGSRKYSHLSGFLGRFSVSQPAKRCSASSRKLLPKPHRFMLTRCSMYC